MHWDKGHTPRKNGSEILHSGTNTSQYSRHGQPVPAVHIDLIPVQSLNVHSFFYMGQALGQTLLILHIYLPGNHNPLGLGRSRTVQTFCTVSHSGGS